MVSIGTTFVFEERLDFCTARLLSAFLGGTCGS